MVTSEEYNDLAIVILNWNGKKYLEKFLPSVIKHSKNARIIVADNASTDTSISFLREHYPFVEIIQNESNGGFAKGYNLALKKIDANYYLLLNSDIEVTENWLSPLIESVKDEGVAGCQPKVLAFNQKNKFEHAGASGGFIDKNYFPFCRGRILASIEEDQQQYNEPVEVFWATGACLLIKAEIFHKVGGFDSSFFAHMEEIDLCWRIKKMGYSFVVAPRSVVYHVGGGTLPYSSPRKTFLNFRNSLLMIAKNHEGILFPKLLWRLCIDGVAGISFLAKGDVVNFWAVIKAHFSFYGRLSDVLKKRKQIQQQSTKTNLAGFYSGNVLWSYYVKGIRKTSSLNQNLFRKK